MSGNSRFSFTNHIETATLKNGTGGGAPALDEVAGFPMTNSQTRWRGKLWKQSSGASGQIDFDLGSNKSFACAALLGHRPVTGNGMTSCVVYGATAATGYPPTSGGSWTAIDTISMASSARDGGIVFNSASYRYVRFDYTCFTAFTLGRCFVGALTDLGLVYAPGSEEYLIQPRADHTSPFGQLFSQWGGDDYERFALRFDPTDATLRSTLRTLAKKKQTLVYVDYDDVFREVLLAPEIGGPHEFNNPQRWQYGVEMVSLG